MKTKHILLLVMVLVLQGYSRLEAQEISKNFPSPEEAITVEEYCYFLNETQGECVEEALEDRLLLRSGEPGNYVYEAAAGKEEVAMPFLSWEEMMEYCTWRNQFLGCSVSVKPLTKVSIDPVLGSTLPTFDLVTTIIYEASGGPLAEEAGAGEILDDILAAMFAGGMVTEGRRMVEERSAALNERNGPLSAKSLAIEQAHFHDASERPTTPESSIQTSRQFSSGSSGEKSVHDRTSSEEESVPGSFVDHFIEAHRHSFDAFERMHWRESNSSEEHGFSFHQNHAPAAPLVVKKSGGERKSTGTDLSTTSDDSGHHPTSPNKSATTTAPSTPEKAFNLAAHEATILPRTGLTVKECASILKDFTDWRDAIGRFEEEKNAIPALASAVATAEAIATKEAKKFPVLKWAGALSKTKQENYTKELADARTRLQQAEARFAHTTRTIEQLGKRLDGVAAKIAPPAVPEKGDEQYPEFALNSGIPIEQARQAYRQRQQLLASGNTPKIEDYLLHSSSINSALIWPFLERQALLNQKALFQQKGYWLDFNDPLKGPHYSFDPAELTQRTNQTHGRFMELAVSYMSAAFSSATSHLNGKIRYVDGQVKKENFFKLPPTRLLEEAKANALNLIVGSFNRNLNSFIKGALLSETEVQERTTEFASRDHKKLQEEKGDARRYLNWIFGTETKLTNNKVRAERINASAPFTRKQFLTEQRNYDVAGECSSVFYDQNWDPIGRFYTKESVQPYVNLFHRQSIKAASLLDQYRIMMLPHEQLEAEVARLQTLTPEEREAELFTHAGISDWQLPTTPEELQAYILKEKAKWDQLEEARKKEEEEKKKEEEARAAALASSTKSYSEQERERKKREEARWAQIRKTSMTNSSLQLGSYNLRHNPIYGNRLF